MDIKDLYSRGPIWDTEIIHRLENLRLPHGDSLDIEYAIKLDPNSGEVLEFSVLEKTIRRGVLQEDGSFK